jgi:hypothetical protein
VWPPSPGAGWPGSRGRSGGCRASRDSEVPYRAVSAAPGRVPILAIYWQFRQYSPFLEPFCRPFPHHKRELGRAKVTRIRRNGPWRLFSSWGGQVRQGGQIQCASVIASHSDQRMKPLFAPAPEDVRASRTNSCTTASSARSPGSAPSPCPAGACAAPDAGYVWTLAIEAILTPIWWWGIICSMKARSKSGAALKALRSVPPPM